MKVWQVKMLVQAYLIFKEKIEIENITFFYENNNNYALVSVNSKSAANAETIAIQKVSEILSAFMVITNTKFECSIIETNEIITELHIKHGYNYLHSSCIVRRNFPSDKVSEVKRIFELLCKSNKIGISAYNYFVRGLKIELWNNEAFLSYFKAIELISGEYISEAKDERFNKIEDEYQKLFGVLQKELIKGNTEKILNINKKIYYLGFVGLKERIILALKDLHLEEYQHVVSDLIELRNGIAHPGSETRIVTDSELGMCKDITLKIILNYMEKLN